VVGNLEFNQSLYLCTMMSFAFSQVLNLSHQLREEKLETKELPPPGLSTEGDREPLSLVIQASNSHQTAVFKILVSFCFLM
jgi:hypothetical protein